MKKKNFEEFSKIMNDNAAIDAPKQEGAVTLPQNMPTIPQLNADAFSAPVDRFNERMNTLITQGALTGLQASQQIQTSQQVQPKNNQPLIISNVSIGDASQGRMNVLSPEDENTYIPQWGTDNLALQPGGVSTRPTTSGTSGEGEETPTVENIVTSGAVTPTVEGADKLDYDAWRAEYGIDTEAEFNAAKAQLEYEMATWRENYGANAERLAQMGLSNSGVVDIYGTGVIQAYAQSMNDLFLAKIDAENAQLDRYKAYSDDYEYKKAQATAAKNTAINEAYTYGLGLYNGDNLEAVSTMIANAGYEADEVEAAVARLQTVDPSMLPALQAEQAAHTSNVNAAYDYGFKLYDGENIQAVQSVLENLYGKEAAAEAIAKLQAVDPSMLPAIQNKQATDQANILEAFNSLAANYKPEQADGLRKLYGPDGIGWSEEAVESLITMLNGYAETVSAAGEEHELGKQLYLSAIENYSAETKDMYAQQWKTLYGEEAADEIEWALGELDKFAAENAAAEEASKPSEEQIINDAASRLLLNVFTDEEGNVIYSGSQTQKNHIRQLMALSEYKDLAPYVDQIIAQMDADYASRKSAAAADTASNIERIDTKDITFDAIGQELDAAALQYGADSEEYKAVETAIGNKTYEAFNSAMNDTIYFDAAYNLVGVSAEEWAEMSEVDKMDKIINRAGEALDDGYITKDKYYSLITDAVTSIGRDYDDIVKWSNVHLKLGDYVEAGWLKDYEVQGLDYKLMNGVKFESVRLTMQSAVYDEQFEIKTSAGDIIVEATAQYSDVEKIFNADSKSSTNAVMNIGDGKISIYNGVMYVYTDGQAYKVNRVRSILGTSTGGSDDNKNAVYQMLFNYVKQKKTWG